MKIKASEMERMFCLSPNGIKLYEKHGIIMPLRDEKSRYRQYRADEVQAMGYSAQLRRFGFSMQETAQLLCHMDSSAQMDALCSRSDAIEAEINQLMRIRKQLATKHKRAQQAHRLMNSCETEDKPAMYFLGTHRQDVPLCDATIDQLGAWFERYTPHLSSALLFDGPFFIQDSFPKAPLGGVAVDAEIALELGLLAGEHVTYLPPKPCIVTGVRINNSQPDLSEAFARIHQHADENGLALHGGGFLSVIQCVREGDALYNVCLLWARLARDERQFGKMR